MSNHDDHREQPASQAESPEPASPDRAYGGDDGALEHEGGQLAAPDETAPPGRTPAPAAQEERPADRATGRENTG